MRVWEPLCLASSEHNGDGSSVECDGGTSTQMKYEAPVWASEENAVRSHQSGCVLPTHKEGRHKTVPAVWITPQLSCIPRFGNTRERDDTDKWQDSTCFYRCSMLAQHGPVRGARQAHASAAAKSLSDGETQSKSERSRLTHHLRFTTHFSSPHSDFLHIALLCRLLCTLSFMPYIRLS